MSDLGCSLYLKIQRTMSLTLAFLKQVILQQSLWVGSGTLLKNNLIFTILREKSSVYCPMHSILKYCCNRNYYFTYHNHVSSATVMINFFTSNDVNKNKFLACSCNAHVLECANSRFKPYFNGKDLFNNRSNL